MSRTDTSPEAGLRERLERGLRRLITFRSLELHPPAVGSEPFFDGRSLSFPLKRLGADIALVVLDGVESLPAPHELLAACANLMAEGPAEAATLPRPEPGRPQVAEVLPLGKVVVSGLEGLAPGGRLLIMEKGDGAPPAFKAKAEVLSAQEGRAVARIVSRGDPFAQVRPGDLIAPVQAAVEDAPAEPAGEGLAAFRRALEQEAAGWERFAVLAAALSGGEIIRTRFGTARLEALLAELAAAMRAFGGSGTVTGREGAELVLGAFPGKTGEEAIEVHGRLSSLAAALAGVVTAGCADFPALGFGRAEALDNALKALEHAKLLGPGKSAVFNAVSLNVSGDALYAAGDLAGAVKEYLKALEIDPEDTNVLNSLGVCYANLGLLPEAKAQFRRAIAVRPGEVMAHYNLGFAHLKLGEKRDALESFQAAARLEPANLEVNFQLGKLLLAAGRAAEAKEHLLAAAGHESRPYIHRLAGDCLLQLGESAEAAAHYKRAVKANPNDPHCLSQLAAIYLELGSDLEVAVSLLKKSVEIEPDSALHQERLAAALARLPQPAKTGA